MNKKVGLFFLVLGLVTACSQESKIRDVVQENAEKQLRQETEAEADKAFSGKDILRKNYVNAIVSKSEVSVENVVVHDADATATARIHLAPDKVRGALLEILRRLDVSKTDSFNMSDALRMISQQMQVPAEETSEKSIDYKLHKDGDWKVQTPGK